jgi:CD109 antigen
LPLGGPIAPPAVRPGAALLGAARVIAPPVTPQALGARETFADAGVVVLTNRQVPSAPLRPTPTAAPAALMRAAAAPLAAAPPVPAASAAEAGVAKSAADAAQPVLAEVQRVRQFFPETWIWTDLTTDAAGQATHRVDVPDSITTWMLRAVALSKDKGLGIGEAQLRAFQPFFVSIDLPYASIRGEEFPAKVALYNYQSTPQDFVVDLAGGDWFDLVDVRSKTVSVGPNGVGAVQFTIRPTGLGPQSLNVTARSPGAADSIVKSLLIEPEGVKREVVENAVLVPGAPRQLALAVPADAVSGSARRYLAVTGNVLTQTIDGLDQLLQMPFGCGEQNMILFAPDVSIARYLKETNQLKPEVMAKAEMLMLTGYQRELTYRRSDGSFSAFGENDPQGSLWLTAFVLKTFAQAKDVIFVDDGVLASARAWVRQRQNPDGSFDPFGFLHHQDLLGGLSGKTALTAVVGIALQEAGETAAVTKAVDYLQGKLADVKDAYGMATTAYLLGLAKSSRAQEAHDRLMALAHETEDGLSWGDQRILPIETPLPADQAGAPVARAIPPRPFPQRSAVIETTGYAALALLRLNDPLNAAKAIRWLAAQRNANGGFGSTQDTVIALEAMTEAARTARSDVDATITLRSGSWQKQLRVAPDNADVLQIVRRRPGDPRPGREGAGPGAVGRPLQSPGRRPAGPIGLSARRPLQRGQGRGERSGRRHRDGQVHAARAGRRGHDRPRRLRANRLRASRRLDQGRGRQRAASQALGRRRTQTDLLHPGPSAGRAADAHVPGSGAPPGESATGQLAGILLLSAGVEGRDIEHGGLGRIGPPYWVWNNGAIGTTLNVSHVSWRQGSPNACSIVASSE